MLRLLAFALVFAVASTAVAAPVPKPGKGSDTHVVVETNHGDIVIELFPEKAPKTVANFLGYVDDKFYDGLIFHRVVKDFMIQGGGMEPGLKEKKAKDPIKNESDNGLSNTRGTVVMARTSKPDSATCQFFVNLKDNAFLDAAKSPDKVGYCVFGKVVEGMDVVDKIAGVKISQCAQYSNVPAEDVVIKSVRRKK